MRDTRWPEKQILLCGSDPRISPLADRLRRHVEVHRVYSVQDAIIKIFQNVKDLVALVVTDDFDGGDSRQFVSRACSFGIPRVVVVASHDFVGNLEAYTGPRLRGIDDVVRYVLAGIQSNL